MRIHAGYFSSPPSAHGHPNANVKTQSVNSSKIGGQSDVSLIYLNETPLTEISQERVVIMNSKVQMDLDILRDVIVKIYLKDFPKV